VEGASNPPARRWAGLREAARYAALSLGTLKRFVRDVGVPVYRPRGGRALIDLSELDQAIARSRGGCAEGGERETCR
jgi:excisionase family DNA binding protein